MRQQGLGVYIDHDVNVAHCIRSATPTCCLRSELQCLLVHACVHKLLEVCPRRGGSAVHPAQVLFLHLQEVNQVLAQAPRAPDVVLPHLPKHRLGDVDGLAHKRQDFVGGLLEQLQRLVDALDVAHDLGPLLGVAQRLGGCVQAEDLAEQGRVLEHADPGLAHVLDRQLRCRLPAPERVDLAPLEHGRQRARPARRAHAHATVDEGVDESVIAILEPRVGEQRAHKHLGAGAIKGPDLLALKVRQLVHARRAARH